MNSRPGNPPKYEGVAAAAATDVAEVGTAAATEGNSRYLRASLDWLELRLRRLVEHVDTVKYGRQATQPASGEAATLGQGSSGGGEAISSESDSARGSSDRHVPWRFWRHGPEPILPFDLSPTLKEREQPVLALPAPVADEQIARASREREEAARDASPAPAAIQLAERLGLSDFELDTLLLAAAPELRPGFSALCAGANAVIGLPSSPYPTFAMALAALGDDPAWDVISPERPLRYWRLVEVHQGATQPLNAAALRAEERIVNALNGLDYVDDRLAPYAGPMTARLETPLPPSHRVMLATIERGWRRAEVSGFPDGIARSIQLSGPDTPTKTRLAIRAATALGRSLYGMHVEQLPAPGPELENFARLWLRESILLPLALYVDAHQGLDAVGSESVRPIALRRFLALMDSNTLVFLGVREVWERDGRSDLAVEVRLPTPTEQRDAWTAALEPGDGSGAGSDPAPGIEAGAPHSYGDLADRLTAQFHLDVPDIHALALESRVEAEQTGGTLDQVLWTACRDRVRPRLDALARRIDAKATLDDLVLPDAPMSLIRQIAAQVDQRSRVYVDWGFADRSDRGLGISALFAGESGTGKTMAAEALAHRLDLSLYRIDLSSVVSKYIGETEENLRRVFDAAEEGGVVLFFDEADALFGKRTEVKDSHDRYANIEVNYLLQRMEAYRGLAILATNRKTALDSAFLRRLRFVVPFPFPGIEERRRIWEGIFPPETPTEGLDFHRLARIAVTGGSIAGIAMNAAFLAADARVPVAMPLLLRAARTELLKLERPVNESELTWP